MAFQPAFQPTPVRPKSQGRRTPKLRQFLGLLQINFSLFTWLLVGAIIQGAILLMHPSVTSLLPAVVLLFIRLIDSCLMAFGLKSNVYMTGDVIRKRVAGVSIDANGQFTEKPATGKIAVVLLGAKTNHPFGFFGPGLSELGEHFGKMAKDLDVNATTNGFLGQTSYNRYDERGAIEIVNILYFKDLPSVHDFAHSPVHRDGWKWWDATLKEHDYIGINHEIYEADSGSWESVYVNFQPTGLGATSYLRRGGKLESGIVPDQWINPLVDASRNKLSRSSGRLGWDPTKHDERHPMAQDVYA